MNSILQGDLIAGGRDTQEGRQTVFFTPFDRTGDETEEEDDALTKPRKVPTRTGGRFLRMQSVGSLWKKHKKKDDNSGRPDLTQVKKFPEPIHVMPCEKPRGQNAVCRMVLPTSAPSLRLSGTHSS